MDKVALITGLSLIAAGFLVKVFPMLIAGYNTMPKEEREKVDVKGLSSCIRNGLIIIGVLVIVGNLTFTLLDYPDISKAFIPITIFVGALLIVVRVQKFKPRQ